MPSPIGSQRRPGSAAAQVPAALRGGEAGSRPACVSSGMYPVPRNTEPNLTLPLCGIPGPQPRGLGISLCHQRPGSCFLPLRFKGIMLALGATGPAPVLGRPMFSDPFGFRWSRPGRPRSPLPAEGSHRVPRFSAQRSGRRSLRVFPAGEKCSSSPAGPAEGVEGAPGPWWGGQRDLRTVSTARVSWQLIPLILGEAPPPLHGTLSHEDARVSQTQDHAREGRGGRTLRISGAGAAGSTTPDLKAPHRSTQRRGLCEVFGEGDPVSPLGRLRRVCFCAGTGALPRSSVSSSHSIRTSAVKSQRPQVKGHRAPPAHWSRYSSVSRT